MKLRNSKLLFLIPSSIILLILAWVGLAAITTSQTLQAAKNQNWQRSASLAKNSLILVKPIEAITFDQVAAVTAWQEGLSLILLTAEGQTYINQFRQGLITSDQAAFDENFYGWWRDFFHSYSRFSQAAKKSLLIEKILSKEQIKLIEAGQQLLAAAEPLINTAADQDLNFTILLKNSQELRAGGGFMGSAAVFGIQNGHISQPVFYDIYDLAGQTSKTLPPKPGFKQFLSEGSNMSITDANWAADFSVAGEDIVSLLNSSSIHKTDVLIALNLNFIESILQITGPIDISSSQETVTADNLGALARAGRLEFFAGDQQKKHFLTQLYSQLKIELEKMSTQELIDLAHMLNSAFEKKQLMFYSPRPDFQQSFIDHKIAGAVQSETDHWLYLLESNVGINKANQAVDREVKIDIQAEKISIEIMFTNSNQPLNEEQIKAIEENADLLQAAHLGYVNYQRLLTDLNIAQVNVACENKKTELIEKNQVSIYNDQALQIGFLLTVPEQAKQTCLIELTPSQPISPNQTWTVIKQPGLNQVPYTVNFFADREEFVLESDKQF